jgi:hypothetical protein
MMRYIYIYIYIFLYVCFYIIDHDEPSAKCCVLKLLNEF